jgi:mevalonate kinase
VTRRRRWGRWPGCAPASRSQTICWRRSGAAAALAKGDVDGLGRIFDAAHGILAALRLSGPELETLIHAARAAGAIGAKLTGAGGGGAVIALAPGHERDVIKRWKAAGFDGFLAEIKAAGPHTLPSSGGHR